MIPSATYVMGKRQAAAEFVRPFVKTATAIDVVVSMVGVPGVLDVGEVDGSGRWDLLALEVGRLAVLRAELVNGAQVVRGVFAELLGVEGWPLGAGVGVYPAGFGRVDRELYEKTLRGLVNDARDAVEELRGKVSAAVDEEGLGLLNLVLWSDLLDGLRTVQAQVEDAASAVSSVLARQGLSE